MNKVTYILIAIIIILAVIVGVMSVRKPVTNDAREIQYQNQIDSLKTAIVGYQEQREDSIIAVYKQDNIILASKMDSVKSYISWLKQDYDDQIDDILNYNSNDLNKFFADRYPR
jgi:hypothetical protein